MSSVASSSRISLPEAPRVPLAIPQPAALAQSEQTALPLPSTSETNIVDDFFGSTLSRQSTTESRHDSGLPNTDVLPSYTETTAPPPEYRRKDEPVTLASYLFKFGFLFFPFWIIGSCILLSPLTAPPPSSPSTSWLPEKTDEERQEIIAKLRVVEVKWAKRCLYALIGLLLLALVLALAIWQIKSA